MAAPKGNQFWRARSSHGPNPKFKDPSELWEACCEYFDWAHENPWNKVDFKGKNVERVEIPTERPLSIGSLCIFLDISRGTWNEWRDKREDLSEVIGKAEEIIYNQKLEGAAVGAFNASIVARELGLAEKTEQRGMITVVHAEPGDEEI